MKCCLNSDKVFMNHWKKTIWTKNPESNDYQSHILVSFSPGTWSVYNAPLCKEKGSCFWNPVLDGCCIQEPVLKRKTLKVFDFFPYLFCLKNQHPKHWAWNCLSSLRNRSLCGVPGAATCHPSVWLGQPSVQGNAAGPEHGFLLNLQDAEITIQWSRGFK